MDELLNFTFDYREAESPLVAGVWSTYSGGGGSFTSSAVSQWEMVITKQYGNTTLSIRGPETKASPAPIPEDAEFVGITFKHGTFMPHLPFKNLVDGAIHLPEARRNAFWMNGSAWEFPNFENVDTFISRMVRDGLLVHEPIVSAILRGELQDDLSLRSVQRRFLRATGLPHNAIRQIERARRAVTLLQQGVPILDTVFELGYADQPHLTRALRHMIGYTPAQILRLNQTEEERV